MNPHSKRTLNLFFLLNAKTLLSSVCMITIIAACGIPIYLLLSQIPYIEMPYFIGCLFAGAIAGMFWKPFM